jgi:hypothetical protein
LIGRPCSLLKVYFYVIAKFVQQNNEMTLGGLGIHYKILWEACR